MIKPMFFFKPKGQELFQSGLFCEKTFYHAFVSDLRKAKSEVIIESPFIACKRTESLLPVLRKLARRGVKVRINTRNPAHHERELRIQAWKSIKMLRNVGVKVCFYSDMRHRKLAVIDRAVLWEGSLNIMSQSYSKEIMRRTASPELALQMIRFTGMNRWSWF
ncbi:MAG: phospholipase D-like domain-containing protein [Candidatus Saccharimonadales bacterium]